MLVVGRGKDVANSEIILQILQKSAKINILIWTEDSGLSLCEKEDTNMDEGKAKRLFGLGFVVGVGLGLVGTAGSDH